MPETAKATMDDNVFEFPQIGKLEGTEASAALVPAPLQPQGAMQPLQVASDLPWYREPKNWLMIGGLAVGGYLIYKSFQPDPPFIPLDDMDGVEPAEDFFADVAGEGERKPRKPRKRKSKAKSAALELAEALSDADVTDDDAELAGAPEPVVLPANTDVPAAAVNVTPSEMKQLAAAPKKRRKPRKMPPRDPHTGAFLSGVNKAKRPKKRKSRRPAADEGIGLDSADY